jgi:Helix-turn-helix.
MAAVTGQMLRLLRERQGIGLRAVARRSRGGMALSDSHLSRVERGERQVTPAVMAAYERAIGIPITVDVISDLAEQHPHQDREWERFHSNIAMLAGGGP